MTVDDLNAPMDAPIRALEAREKAEAEAAAAKRDRFMKDALRWRALVKSTGREIDMSSGPWSGKGKYLLIRINCTGCAKYLESGAPDYEGTLNAAMDDEIRLQGSADSASDR